MADKAHKIIETEIAGTIPQCWRWECFTCGRTGLRFINQSVDNRPGKH